MSRTFALLWTIFAIVAIVQDHNELALGFVALSFLTVIEARLEVIERRLDRQESDR